MKKLALLILFVGSLLAHAQVNFQVRALPFSETDSIVLLVDHPNGNEVVRIFANATSGQYLQRGLLRERGDRLVFPTGEQFYCWDKNNLITESFNQNRQLASVRALRLKRYQVNKTRLSLLEERVDSLEGLAAPLWRRWEGRFLKHPACQNLNVSQNKALLALQRQGTITLQAFRNQEQLPFFNKPLALTASGNLAGEPWVKPLLAAPDRWLVTSYWYNGKGLPQAWLAALDTSGTTVWERALAGSVVEHFHPLGMLLIVKENDLLGQQLEASDSRTGAILWNRPLFELYNNDSLFSLSSLNPKDVDVLDTAPVLGGAYTAVLMTHKKGQDPILFVLDDQGKPVYRYALDSVAKMARLQERDTGFALVTEHGSWLFRPR